MCKIILHKINGVWFWLGFDVRRNYFMNITLYNISNSYSYQNSLKYGSIRCISTLVGYHIAFYRTIRDRPIYFKLSTAVFMRVANFHFTAMWTYHSSKFWTSCVGACRIYACMCLWGFCGLVCARTFELAEKLISPMIYSDPPPVHPYTTSKISRCSVRAHTHTRIRHRVEVAGRRERARAI